MRLTHRIVYFLAVTGMLLHGQALANDFPTRPITIVVPWPAGGAYDLAARLLADHANDVLEVPLIVQNVTGAAGSNGVRHVANASADGYTVGIMGTHAIVQHFINPNATQLEELTPLTFIGPEPASLAVSIDSGIESVAEYLDHLRRDPGSILNGNDSPGGFSFIAAAMLEYQLDVTLTKIPYQGYAPTVSALLSREVMSATLPIPLVASPHDAGQLKLLGVASTHRHPYTPDVPTFNEQGIDFIAEDFFMLYLPRDVSPDRQQQLAEVFYDLLSTPQFQEDALELGLLIQPRDQQPTRRYLAQRTQDVRRILQEASLIDDDASR